MWKVYRTQCLQELSTLFVLLFHKKCQVVIIQNREKERFQSSKELKKYCDLHEDFGEISDMNITEIFMCN